MTGTLTGAISPICSTIRVFKATKIGGLFAALIRKGRPVKSSGLTTAEAFVAGFNFSLMTLDTPQLSPAQSEVLRKTLDEAMADHQKTGLAGLLGRVAEQVRDRQRDPEKALEGFVSLVNEKMKTEGTPCLTEDQGDALRGMIAGLMDSAAES